jgi:hypothetical protein
MKKMVGTHCFKKWEDVLLKSRQITSDEELQTLVLCGPPVEVEADARTLDYCSHISWANDIRKHARWTLRALMEDITLYSDGRSKMRAEITGGKELLHLLPPPPVLVEYLQGRSPLPPSREQMLQELEAEVQITGQICEFVFGRRKGVDDVDLLQRFERDPLVELWHWLAWRRLAKQAGRGEMVADVMRRVRFRAFVLADFMLSAMHDVEPHQIGTWEAGVANFWDYASLLHPEQMTCLPFFMPELVHYEIQHLIPNVQSPLIELLMRPSATEAPLRILLFWRARGYITNIEDLELLAQARLLCSIVYSRMTDDYNNDVEGHIEMRKHSIYSRQGEEDRLREAAAARPPVAFPALQL